MQTGMPDPLDDLRDQVAMLREEVALLREALLRKQVGSDWERRERFGPGWADYL